MKKNTCDCRLCTRNKKYQMMLDKIEDVDVRTFFEVIYNELGDVEEDNEMLTTYQHNLKRMYPSVYIETHTLEQKQSGDEKHPEINI